MSPQDERLERLERLIADSPHNLVSACERQATRLAMHLHEAQAVGETLGATSGQRWLDLGTGGGIPGLVLASQYPGVEWILLDSVGKKVRAVRAFAAELGLENVSVVTARAESAAHGAGFREAFDGVVARAVAPLVVLVELARGFVRDGGVLVAVKGAGWQQEVADARWAIDRLSWRDVHNARVTSASRPTWLVTMRAAGTAPAGIPRRVGVPQRRPMRGP